MDISCTADREDGNPHFLAQGDVLHFGAGIGRSGADPDLPKGNGPTEIIGQHVHGMGQSIRRLFGRITEGPEHDIGTMAFKQPGLGLTLRRHGDFSGISQRVQVAYQRYIQLRRPNSAHHPAGPLEGQLVVDFRVGHVSVEHGDPPIPPFFQRPGIEVDADDGLSSLQHVIGHPASVVAQPNENGIDCQGGMPRFDSRFPVRVFPLENPQRL